MKFMQDAIEVALQTKNEIPVGAVIVKNGEIIAFANIIKEDSQFKLICIVPIIINNTRTIDITFLNFINFPSTAVTKQSVLHYKEIITNYFL